VETLSCVAIERWKKELRMMYAETKADISVLTIANNGHLAGT